MQALLKSTQMKEKNVEHKKIKNLGGRRSYQDMTHFQANIFGLPKVACIGKVFVVNFMHQGYQGCFVAKKPQYGPLFLYVDIVKMPKGNFAMAQRGFDMHLGLDY